MILDFRNKKSLGVKKTTIPYSLYATPSERGFTLLELIVVIGIMAILAGLILAIVNPLAQFQKANDARRKSDLSQVQKALEQYYQDNGAYPTGSPDHEITNPQLTPVAWGTAWTPYMDIVPADPDSNRSYIYVSTGQSYWIYSSLERGGLDTQACKNTNNSCLDDPFSSACSCDNVPGNVFCGNNHVCTFGTSSPNTTP